MERVFWNQYLWDQYIEVRDNNKKAWVKLVVVFADLCPEAAVRGRSRDVSKFNACVQLEVASAVSGKEAIQK